MAGGFEVDVPDIGVIEFPEGTTEDQANQAIRKHLSSPTLTPTSVPGFNLISEPPGWINIPGGQEEFYRRQREELVGRDPSSTRPEWLTQPLVNIPGPMTIMKKIGEKNPILKPLTEQVMEEHPVVAGLGETAARTVSGMTSPGMIATAAIAPLLPAKLVAGAFSAWQGYNTVKEFPKVKQTISDPNVPNYEKWAAGGDEFASLAFTVAPLLGMTVSRLKSTMTPEQAATVLQEKLPTQPKPTTPEVPNAPQERQVQEGVQPERVGTGPQRVPPEAGGGDSLQPAAEVRPQQPQPEAPKVPLTPPGVNPQAKEWLTHAAYEDESGDVYTGANHPEILDNLGIEGFPTRESRNTPQFGFRTNLRAFVPREEAAQIAKAAGQQLEPFDIGPQGKPAAHSDQVNSPTEPAKTIAEQTPLGLNRPVQENLSLRKLSDAEFAKNFREAKAAVTEQEKLYDQNPNLSPEQRQKLAETQDRFSAFDLERFRRQNRNSESGDIFHKMIELADQGTDYPRFRTLAEILEKRKGVSDAELLSVYKDLPATLTGNTDFREALGGKLKQFKAWMDRYRGGQKPPNPGGAESTLTAEQQAKSRANNSRAAFEDLAKKKEATPLPKSPTETLSTAAQVKVKVPEGATFIRGTTKDGKTAIQPVANFKGDNPFLGVEWKKIEAGTMGKGGQFIPMKGDITVDPQIIGMGGAAYGEVAPKGFSESGAYGGDIYGIAERVRKARVEAGVTEPVPPGPGISGEASVERGRMLLEQGYDYEKALSDFEKTKRFNSDDMMVFRARGEQLALIARRMEEFFGSDSDEWARAAKNSSDWDRRLKAAQTESSRAFSAQQGETDIDTGSYTGLRRARVEQSDKDFTPEQSVKAKKLAKNVATARKAADDANQLLLKTIDEEGKSIKPGTENKTVWDTVRKYASRGMDDFNDIVNKTASDLGMKVADVRRELSKRPAVKRMTDDAYRKAQTLRRIHGNAKMWLKALDTPELLKQLESIPGFMFGLKVWGHGRVALGTHAPLVAFLPEYWKVYAKNYQTMYKMVHDPAFYEAEMQDLKRRPNYVTAQRAGLQNDVFQYEDYVSPEYVKFFGAGRGGNRGYAVLKILRQDMFDQQWNRLPDEMKVPEVAKMIAKDVNHITGVTQKRAFKHANVAFFAPRLLASRLAWLIGDPAQTARIAAKWKTATPAEKMFAINQVKQKAWVVGTAMTMLAANQGMLLALGSKQKINGVPKALGGAGFDPMSSDFMKFKVAGMQFSYGNPMLALARLPLRLWATRNESQKQRRGAYPDESMITEVGRYFRTQLSPFSGLLADLITKTDYANRPLPGTNLPVPSRLRREGKGPYTWPEYIGQVGLPIPLEEAFKEVLENGFGLGKEQLKQTAKALVTIAVMGGTGGRLTEDWRLKEEEQPPVDPNAFQPPQNYQVVPMQPVSQPPQR